MDYRDRITIESDKRGRQPCIRGLRIAVVDVLDYLASGLSEEEILADFPQLEREDIRTCLRFAADGERRLKSPSTDPVAPPCGQTSRSRHRRIERLHFRGTVTRSSGEEQAHVA